MRLGSCCHESVIYLKNYGRVSFAYVDVAVGSVLKKGIEDGIQRIIYSYDSSCGHSVHFFARLADTFPALITRDQLSKFDFLPLIPKFHLAGHKPECSDKYSFNYTDNVGRMSGELVETPWSHFNWLQYSSREMGWGNRRDMLTDHFNAWNWWKIVRIGGYLFHPGCQVDLIIQDRRTGRSTWESYASGIQEMKKARKRLQDLEENLGSEAVERMEGEAARAGGEQYRPKNGATTCELALLCTAKCLMYSLDSTVQSQCALRSARG